MTDASRPSVPPPPWAPLAALSLFAVAALVLFRPALETAIQALYGAAFLFLLHYLYMASWSGRIPALHKLLASIVIILPLMHLLVGLVLDARPFYVYPHTVRLSPLGPWLECKAHGLTLLFVCVFLLFLRPLKAPLEPAALARTVRADAFYLLVLEAVAFGACSIAGSRLALVQGGYGTDGGGALLGINAWNAMSVIALLLSYAYLPRNPVYRPTFLAAATAVVAGASLLFGKRADVIGLAGVLVAVLAVRPLPPRRAALALGIVAAGVATALLVGSLRERGFDQSPPRVQLVIRGTTGFTLPSFTDFYSTFPYVLSYVDGPGGSLWWGRSYLNALSSILPAIVNPLRIDESATTFLQRTYCPFNGGMFFPAELYFNFGAPGVLLGAVLVSKILNVIAWRPVVTRRFTSWCVGLALIAGFPRWMYFGTSTITKQAVLVVLVLLSVRFIVFAHPVRKNSDAPATRPGTAADPPVSPTGPAPKI